MNLMAMRLKLYEPRKETIDETQQTSEKKCGKSGGVRPIVSHSPELGVEDHLGAGLTHAATLQLANSPEAAAKIITCVSVSRNLHTSSSSTILYFLYFPKKEKCFFRALPEAYERQINGYSFTVKL